ncbi:MAG TPA: nitroreductase family protein [Chloroflexota bacterium]|nr:nitroreductase family protein [Chloroflexota bacterium]
MEFQDVVRTRRMVRSFERRLLPPEVVSRILANAQRAPSAGFSQGWAFLVLSGFQETERYWAAVGPDDRAGFQWPDLFNAPLLIVCLSNKAAYLDRYAEPDKAWTDRSEAHWPAPYWDIDTGMAALLILLTAVDAGLGALFFGVPPEKIVTLRETFGIPPGLHPIGTVAVGYVKPLDRPSPSLKRGHRPVDDVIHRGHW